MGEPVAVVRFELCHGIDILNPRIKEGLLIQCKDKTMVFFKSFFTCTGRIRQKTVHLVQFEDVEDINDFLM